jgi:hypothetical protein
MQRQETASGIDRDALKEESVFLRIHQLQNGLVQLTDATTTYRLVAKFAMTFGTSFIFIFFAGLRLGGAEFSPCPFIRPVKKAQTGKMCEKTLLIVGTD